MWRGNRKLQGKDTLSFYCERTKTKIAPLCSRARNKKRYDFCNEKRQTHKPHKYLARNENFVQRCKCKSSKVFPHNLRHLFARTFYWIEKDIAKLADILGHSSINTTRIYIISTGTEHRRRMENMHFYNLA